MSYFPNTANSNYLMSNIEYICVLLRISKIMAPRGTEMPRSVLTHLHLCANLNPVTNGKHTKFFFSVVYFIFVYLSLVSTVDEHNLGDEDDTAPKEKVKKETKGFQRLLLHTVRHNFPR